MDNTVAVALVAGLLGLFLVIQMNMQKQQSSSTSSGENSNSNNSSSSRSAPAAEASKASKKKKKKKAGGKAAAPAVAPAPAPVPEPEPEVVAPAASKKKKKKKAKAAAAAPVVVEAPAPAPEPTPTPEATPEPTTAAGKKKKKKKNKKAAAGDANGDATATTTTNGTSVSTAPVAAPVTDYNNTNTDDDDDGWSTIKKNKKTKPAPVAAGAITTEDNGIQTVTIPLAPEDVPLLIGPKGATIQRLTEETGARLDIDKTSNNGTTASAVKITGDEASVAKAVAVIRSMTSEDAAKRQAATAHSATLSGKDINGATGGVKAIIGKAGVTIKNIQALSGCQLKASIDDGTVLITGPTAEGVAKAVTMCKNAVFGEAQSSIDLQTQSMVMAVCGKGFTHLRLMQDQSGARLDFAMTAAGKKTLLNISGDTAHVQKAKTMIAARMAEIAGITMPFEASKTGAIYGKGGLTLRRIQDTTGATIEVNDGGGTGMGTCKILGEPSAVKAAQSMIEKAISGEIELKEGDVREMVDCGIGAAAVIGRGGSNIKELETTHKVKLNLQSGSGTCQVVGKPEAVKAAKEAIEGIVEPIKLKAIEEAKIRVAAEELAASGDDTWGAAGDGPGSWDDAVEENGW